jgi:hypothetical protein
VRKSWKVMIAAVVFASIVLGDIWVRMQGVATQSCSGAGYYFTCSVTTRTVGLPEAVTEELLHTWLFPIPIPMVVVLAFFVIVAILWLIGKPRRSQKSESHR